MGAFLSAVALVGLTISLLWYRIELASEQVEKGRETLLKLEKESVQKCRKKLIDYTLSQPLPITFDLPVKEICGNFFWVEKRDCDGTFCTYEVSFGKFKEGSTPVFSITKSLLSSWIEAENVKRLRKIAEFLLDYQKSFPDHETENHFLDVADTGGFQTLSAYSDFFKRHFVPYLDRYAEDTGSFSNFQLCTSDGGDCEVQEDAPPFECKIRYVSPYTGKAVEITILDEG